MILLRLVSVLAILSRYTAAVLWCLLLLSQAQACATGTTDKCQPAQATHRLSCIGHESTPVYYDGGYLCAASGGQIDIEGAQCLAFPLEVEP